MPIDRTRYGGFFNTCTYDHQAPSGAFFTPVVFIFEIFEKIPVFGLHIPHLRDMMSTPQQTTQGDSNDNSNKSTNSIDRKPEEVA
jgi:hypothetical protein